MAGANDVLRGVAEAVADGHAVDWAAVESAPMGDGDRSLVAELKLLEQLQRVHRTAGASPSPSSPGRSPAGSPDADTCEDERGGAGESTATDPAPQRWSHLEIREMVGSGGFGVVYRAWDPQLATEVALKVITRGAGAGAAVIQEARLLARVRHANIVSIYGADRWNGQVGLWMEFVRGRTLKQIVQQRGAFGAREAALVGLDLTRALAAVHGAGLVHRDVKPHNVMRDDGGRIILMDFGAGIELDELTVTPPRRYVGTPLYMAPELFHDHKPSPQTDLYSLGIVLYHLVSRGYPFEAASPAGVQAQHERGDRRRLRDARPDLPTEFVRIVERAIDLDPARRYASAGEMEADLAQFVVLDERALAVPHAPDVAAPPPRRRRAAFIAAAVLVLVTAAMVGVLRPWQIWRRPPTTPPQSVVQSLVVLPLRNASGDPAEDYFVDGMTELLTADLSGVSALRIIADSAAERYRGTKKSASEIGQELHVDAVVEGSVARAGNRVRVTLQVVNAGSNLSVWGSSFEGEAGDAFRLQADVTRTLVDQVRAVLTTGERARLAQTYVAKPDAQELYLRARYDMHTHNLSQLIQARALLEHAVQIDPAYALAWAGLSHCYVLLQEYGTMTPDESRRLGMAAATTALAKDPLMYEAHTTMAEALFKFDWNWVEADRHYRDALAANPNNSVARWLYARFLAAAGRVDDAVAEARRAEESNPLTSDTKGTVAMMLYYQRHFAEALGKADEAVTLDAAQQGPHFVRGRALASLGRMDESIRELQEAVRLSGNQPGQVAELGRVYAIAGRRAEAEAILVRLSQPPTPSGGFIAEQDLAYVRLGLGQRDAALLGLEKAVNQKSERILWLRVDPRLDPLRDDPRFQQLIQRIGGLPPAR